MNKIKTILVLAGGDSTRFWPLSQKNLTSFLGKPLIQHVLEGVAPFTNHVVIVTNKNDHASVKQIISELKKKIGCPFELLIQNPKVPSQAGAILAADNRIEGEVLIVNANDVFDFKIIPPLAKLVKNNGWEFALTAKKVRKYFPGGYLKLDKDRLVGIIERPLPQNTPSDFVRLVIDYYSDFKQLLHIIKDMKNLKDDGYEQALNQAIKTLRAGYLPYEDAWYSVKYPWHILTMMRYFLQKLKLSKIRMGKNVRIGKYTKIIGPTYIGDNTVIGDFAMIRESHIGENCVVGGYCEVTRSYLGNNVELHRNYVGDSVLGQDVSMGAGAVTANYRFDGKPINSELNGTKMNTGLNKLGAVLGMHARIGVNASILPGIKIGKNTFVGPGSIIDKNIPENMFVLKGKMVKNRLSL